MLGAVWLIATTVGLVTGDRVEGLSTYQVDPCAVGKRGKQHGLYVSMTSPKQLTDTTEAVDTDAARRELVKVEGHTKASK